MQTHAPGSDRLPLAICIVLAAIALFRIVATYSSISLAYDEPAHIACGMEWLDKGTFKLEPLHPPLARVASAIGPYLAGARLPEVQLIHDPTGAWFDVYPAGNEILYTGNRYARNLVLARLGELPFFLVGVSLVFLWTRNLFGPWGAVFGVLLYTTLPTILAFAGLAYVDFALSVFLPGTLFAFVRWLERPSLKRASVLGVAFGLAVLSNLSALLFAPICLAAITVGWIWKRNTSKHEKALVLWSYLKTTALAIFLSVVVIWGGYRFSVVPLNEAFARPTEDLSQLPAPVRSIASAIVNINPPVPAPDFLKGILASWTQNKKSPPAYALGQIRRGGFWYFYWLDLGLKTPLPFLLLAAGGLFLSLRRNTTWQILAPVLSAIAILLVSMVVKVDFGIRHVLFIYPLLAIICAGAAVHLWRERARWPRVVPAVLFALLVWQVASSVSARPDYIAYFNVLAGAHPEERLLFGCDLDCGQDVEQLARTANARGIDHLSLQLWTSADLHRMNLPPFETLSDYKPANGWVAVSLLYLRSGHAIWDATSPDAYAWLNAHQPVEYVGKTIRLYHIPEESKPDLSRSPSP